MSVLKKMRKGKQYAEPLSLISLPVLLFSRLRKASKTFLDQIEAWTKAYSRSLQQLGDQEQASTLAQDALISLKVLANRANASLVESALASSASPSAPWPLVPQVIDQQMLTNDTISSYLNEGKIALALVYAGEKQVTGESYGDDGEVYEETESALRVDLWAVIDRLYPSSVPPGLRINHLTLLDRLILQSITNVETISGPDAVSELTLLLMVDEQELPW